MIKPKVSVITVVYNGIAHLEQALLSVIEQEYKNVEHIVIDGGSTDGTVDLIKKYEPHLAYWVSEKDSGIYNAMNKGWKKASGDLIAILNADDYYLPGALQQVADCYADQQADVIYGNLTKLRTIGKENFFKEITPNIELMEKTMGIFHPSSFVKRSVYEELDGYNETYQLSSDYDFLLRAYQKKYHFLYLNQSLAVFRIGGVSNTNCDSYKEGYEILKIHSPKHADAMYTAWENCKKKRKRKGFVLSTARALGLQGLINHRIKKKWKN